MTLPAMNPSSDPVSTEPPVRLLQRPACLLCLEAEWVLAQAGIDRFQRIDIERSADLECRYGQRIPVLVDHRGRELDWPFDAAAVNAWMMAGQ